MTCGSVVSLCVDMQLRGEGGGLRPYLVHPKIQKLFKISRHIESYGTCMKH